MRKRDRIIALMLIICMLFINFMVLAAKSNNNMIKQNIIMDNVYIDNEYYVNSFHEMIAPLEMVEPFAKVSSVSEDGLVESFELENKKFVIGVKWHPEQMLDDEYVDELFDAFILACKDN